MIKRFGIFGFALGLMTLLAASLFTVAPSSASEHPDFSTIHVGGSHVSVDFTLPALAAPHVAIINELDTDLSRRSVSGMTLDNPRPIYVMSERTHGAVFDRYHLRC